MALHRAAPLLLALLALLAAAHAHSWIECTDYRGDPDTYQPDRCFGYARGYAQRKAGTAFGQDVGFEYRGALQTSCQYARPDSLNDLKALYTPAYPMAVYKPGQTVCLAWPAKNHAADEGCTGRFIPDNQNKVYISPVNPTRDPTRAEFVDSLLHDIGTNPFGTTEHKGFQNCTKNFCDNTDKALCQGCFVVPPRAAGTYTLQWFWEFNAGEFYATCFEVEIQDGGNPGNPSPSPSPNPNPSPSPSSSPVPPQPPTGTPATPSNFRVTVEGNIVQFHFTTVPGSTTHHYAQLTGAGGLVASKYMQSALVCAGGECTLPLHVGSAQGTVTAGVIGFDMTAGRYSGWSAQVQVAL